MPEVAGVSRDPAPPPRTPEWQAWVEEIQAKMGRQICGAKTKGSGLPCVRLPNPDNGKRCWLHGGATPTGPALPHFKHGKYSRNMPTRLLQRYEEFADNPELLELRHELALTDTRISELIERLHPGEAPPWRQVQSLFSRLVRAYAVLKEAGAEDEAAVERFEMTVDALGTVIQEGAADEEVWKELMMVLEGRRRLAETERKRLEALQQYITIDKAMGLVAALVETVQRHVKDRDALVGITQDLRRLLQRGQEVSRIPASAAHAADNAGDTPADS